MISDFLRLIMRESIIIKNLGPIREVELPDIRQMTVLVGKSATGKSAVMKALAMMRYIFKRENIKQYLKYSNIKRSPIRTVFKNVSKLGTLISANTEILYSVEINSNRYTVECKNKKIIFSGKIEKEDLTFFKGSYISESRSIIPSLLERLSSRNIKLGFYEEETLNDFEEATYSSEEYNISFLQLKLKMKKSANKGKMFYIVGNDKSEIKIQDSSSGIQNASPVIAIINYFAGEKFSFKDAFSRSVIYYLMDSNNLNAFKAVKEINELRKVIQIHLEEPELSLDPMSQMGMLEDLTKVTFDNHSHDRYYNLIMATHSPYIINYLNVLIERFNHPDSCDTKAKINPEELAVYKIENGKSESLLVHDNNQYYVDTNWFSEPMNTIYGEYENLLEPYNEE